MSYESRSKSRPNNLSNGYSNGYANGDSNGRSWNGEYNSYSSTGDKMANIGSGLKKQTFDLSTLAKFEKNFYREADSVKLRSEREIQEFRERKEIKVYGQHVPRPVETFEEAGFPCMHLFH